MISSVRRVLSSRVCSSIIQNKRLFSSEGTMVSDTSGDRLGLDLIYHRASNIIKNTADGQWNKILHICFDNEFYKHFGNMPNFELLGCSDYPEDVKKCMVLKQYKKAELVSADDEFPFRATGKIRGFHVVVCMYPPRRSGSEKPFLTSEILSLVNDNGIAIIGARNGYWRSEEAMEYLQEFECDGLELRSFQEVPLHEHDYKNGRPVDILSTNTIGTESATINSIAPGSENDTYWLAVLKRCKIADPDYISPKIK